MLGKFAHGVRVFVRSGRCHSGSVVKLAYYRGTPLEPTATASEGTKYRFMPTGVALRTYRQNKDFYDKLLKDTGLKKAQEAVKAPVLLISGCQDNQLSADG